MKFLIQEPQKDKKFSLVYENFSFDIEPFYQGGITSIMINDLQLEIDDYGQILYPWGYCPLIKYEDTDTFPENYTSNSLVALLDRPPVPGISYRINENKLWSIYINKKKGWICVGSPITTGKQLIEFAPNCVATMENQEIIAVWLKPKNLPKL